MSQYHSLVLCRSRMQIPKKCCFTFCEIEDDQSIHLKEDCCRHFKIGLELFKKEEHISYRHRLFSRAISTLVIFSTIQTSSISLCVSLSTSLYHTHKIFMPLYPFLSFLWRLRSYGNTLLHIYFTLYIYKMFPVYAQKIFWRSILDEHILKGTIDIMKNVQRFNIS